MTNNTRRRHGLTLVEMVVSMGIMSVLAVGISSAMVVSARSIERSDSPSACIRQAAGVSEQIVEELTSAVAVPERATNAITIDVPDRDGDGNSEEIRYAWSGSAGGAITRQYNSDAVCTLLTNVYAFNLGYEEKVCTVPRDPSSDLLLAEHVSPNDVGSFRVGNYNYASQCFVPTLPSGTGSWRVTRIELYCASVGSVSGQLILQLVQPALDGRPTSVSYGQATIDESALSSTQAWRSVALSSSSLSTSQAACLLLRGSTSDVCELRFHTRNVAESGWCYATTNTLGLIWTIKNNQAMLFRVYGVAVGANGSAITTETLLSGVRFDLQVGSNTKNRINAGAQLLNLPR